jgi:hypothetical protein
MTLKEHFRTELEILKKQNKGEELIITDFVEDIYNIIDKFSKQGHSGGSAPYYSHTISETIKNVLSYKPLSPIENDDNWNDVDNNMFQNKRESALFKDGIDGRPYYIDAVVWQGVEEYDTYTGSNEETYSRQYVKFPFTPKTFYIDVIRVYDTIENITKLGYNYSEEFSEKGLKTGRYYYTKIKNITQFREVAKIYELIDSKFVNDDIKNMLLEDLRVDKIKRVL